MFHQPINPTSVMFPNATSLAPASPEYFSTEYRVIGTLVVSAIFLVGCLGNVLVVVVVCRCRGMYTPTNCYLVSLAVADVLLLVFAALPTIVEYFLKVDEYIFGSVGCSVSGRERSWCTCMRVCVFLIQRRQVVEVL